MDALTWNQEMDKELKTRLHFNKAQGQDRE